MPDTFFDYWRKGFPEEDSRKILHRVFIATLVADASQRELAGMISDQFRSRVRVLPPENWHLPIIPQRDIAMGDCLELIRRAQQTPLGTSFSVRISRLAALPSPEQATTLCLEVSLGDAQVRSLRAAIEEVMLSAGLELNHGSYPAHIVVGRTQKRADLRDLFESVTESNVRVPIRSVAVLHRKKGSAIDRYENLAVFHLPSRKFLLPERSSTKGKAQDESVDNND
ncbi:MAG TPA: hypothetical protein VF710_25710 [Longimicrobium sp.]|jgi:2'-5' RNA ligase